MRIILTEDEVSLIRASNPRYMNVTFVLPGGTNHNAICRVTGVDVSSLDLVYNVISQKEDGFFDVTEGILKREKHE